VPDAGDEVGWARLAHAATFPAVLKPRRSESSRNTLPVGSMADLRAAVASLAATEASGLVLEAYLADRPARTRTPFADYVSVESLVSGGRVVHLATNGRFPTSAPFRETGFFIPADLPGAEDEAVRTLATAAVRALGVGGGLLHTEIKLTPDGPRVIEVNGRIGGGVAEMLRRTAGLELLPLALRLALGQDVAIAEPQARGVAYILLVQPPTTIDRVTAIEGLDAVRDLDGVEVVAVNRAAGEAVDWRAGTEEFAVGVEGRVADHAALAALATRVQRSVVVRGERTRTRLAALAAPALLVAEALGAAV
jgi:biotin carboxylase